MSVEIQLPTLHPGQVAAYTIKDPNTGKPPRFLAVRCGRRWGKTDFGKVIAATAAIQGQRVGWFGPNYRIVSEAYNEVLDVVSPLKKSSSKTDGMIRLTTGGSIEWWTLENDRAGRSRKYHLVIVDEAAFTKSNMKDIWEKAIMPTLLDYKGSAVVLSNTNGEDPENFFWRICNEHKLDPDQRFGFVQYQAPTAQNPYMPKDEIERLRKNTHPLVFAQEYEAEFVDWSGTAFFSQASLLEGGVGLPWPSHCDYVFAVIDSAIKTGREHDGTAVTYYARNVYSGTPLVILDWDIVQIAGDLLEGWLDVVFQNLLHLAGRVGARRGSLGAFIEDKASGQVMIMAAQRRGKPAHAIPSVLTSHGKDERAIAVSGYVYRGDVKITQEALDKTVHYKGVQQNHFLAQVCGFKIGVKDQSDDALDTFTYGVAITLGNSEGI